MGFPCKNGCGQLINWNQDVAFALCANKGFPPKNRPLNDTSTDFHNCPNYNKSGYSGGGNTSTPGNNQQLASFERQKVDPITVLDATKELQLVGQNVDKLTTEILKKQDQLKLSIDLLSTYIKVNRVDEQEKRLTSLETQVASILELVTAMAHSDPSLHNFQSAAEIAEQK